MCAVKLGDLQSALDQFEKSLEMARTQKDGAAESAIRKAIEEVNGRIVNGVKTEKDSGDNSEHPHTARTLIDVMINGRS